MRVVLEFLWVFKLEIQPKQNQHLKTNHIHKATQKLISHDLIVRYTQRLVQSLFISMPFAPSRFSILFVLLNLEYIYLSFYIDTQECYRKRVRSNLCKVIHCSSKHPWGVHIWWQIHRDCLSPSGWSLLMLMRMSQYSIWKIMDSLVHRAHHHWCMTS